uniref:Uncharacterized protein n=1 Tax=Oryza punctata TaxID=4537 RepID=A0A0E0KFI1_ORYPU
MAIIERIGEAVSAIRYSNHRVTTFDTTSSTTSEDPASVPPHTMHGHTYSTEHVDFHGEHGIMEQRPGNILVDKLRAKPTAAGTATCHALAQSAASIVEHLQSYTQC